MSPWVRIPPCPPDPHPSKLGLGEGLRPATGFRASWAAGTRPFPKGPVASRHRLFKMAAREAGVQK